MLSIVLPGFRASETLNNQLPAFLDYLRRESIDHEIIVVDDGSPDQAETQTICNKLGIGFLPLHKNQGKGAAVRQGVFRAKGDYILFTDVDIPFQFEAFPQFLNILQTGTADLAIGDRTLPQSTYFTEISRLRKLGSDVFSALVGRFITTGVYDTQCGMKGFTRQAALQLFGKARINRFAFDVEILFLARRQSLVVKQLPVTFRCNEGSSVKVVRHGLQMVFDLIRIIWYHSSGAYRRSANYQERGRINGPGN